MGVVIRRWVWLESIGVVSGCFPHITYISLLHLFCSFLQQHPYFFFHFVIYIAIHGINIAIDNYSQVTCVYKLYN